MNRVRKSKLLTPIQTLMRSLELRKLMVTQVTAETSLSKRLVRKVVNTNASRMKSTNNSLA